MYFRDRPRGCTSRARYIAPNSDTSLAFRHIREHPDSTVAGWIKSSQCPVNIHEVTSLVLHPINADEIRMITPILPILSRSLKSLSINPPVGMQLGLENQQAIQAILVDLSALPCLNQFSFTIFEDREVDIDHFSWLMAELSTVPNSNRIKCLQIVTRVLYSKPPRASVSEMTKRWERLDEVLSQAKFNGVRDVCILLRLYYTHADDWQIWIDWIQDVMGKTKESKTLSISVMPENCKFPVLDGITQKFNFAQA
ncbi:hypothetical protein AX16_006837 [Volvariella volvacea WC 439]|nr:hypothetical protein AX16_006837 [Volvariella volvacea WC 439]